MKLIGATVEYRDPDNWLVGAVWSDVDRACTGGWCVRTNDVALRLARAIVAGHVYANPTRRVDINGRSYVEADYVLPCVPIEQALDEIEERS